MKFKGIVLLTVLIVAVGVVFRQPFKSTADPKNGVLQSGELLPTGMIMRITPSAASDSTFQPLNPNLATRPEFVARQAVATATSPDGNTLLILTSGYNRNNDPSGQGLPAESNEYVFVYDISGNPPVKQQVLQLPNTFNGIAWNPNGAEFYVSGGVNDNVHIFEKVADLWMEVGVPTQLGDSQGLGLSNTPMAAGLAVNSKGDLLLVANFGNDSVSLIDLKTRTLSGEIDLRPGKADPDQSGVPGGEYPFWVATKGNDRAYVSSQRDREIIIVSLSPLPSVLGRIPVEGQPNKMVLNKAQSFLFVALNNSDSVAVVDTASNQVIDMINTTAPHSVFPNPKGFKGSNPNSVALSPDDQSLFVTR